MNKLITFFNNDTINIENYIKLLYSIKPELTNWDLYKYEAYEYFKNFKKTGLTLTPEDIRNYIRPTNTPPTPNETTEIENYCKSNLNKESCICYATATAQIAYWGKVVKPIIDGNNSMQIKYENDLKNKQAEITTYYKDITDKTTELQNFRKKMCLAGNSHCCYWLSDDACSGPLEPMYKNKLQYGDAEMENADNQREYVDENVCKGIYDSGWWRKACTANLKYTDKGVGTLIERYKKTIHLPTLPPPPQYQPLPAYSPQTNCCINIIEDITSISDAQQQCDQKIITIIEEEKKVKIKFSCNIDENICSQSKEGNFDTVDSCVKHCDDMQPTPPPYSPGPSPPSPSPSPPSPPSPGPSPPSPSSPPSPGDENNNMLMYIIISIISVIIIILLGIYLIFI